MAPIFNNRTQMAGRWLLAGLIVAVALGLLGSQWWLKKNRLDRQVGITIEAGEGGIRIVSVSPGYPADMGGVRPGDLLIAIGDRRMTRPEDYDPAAGEFRRGQPVRFLVLRDGVEKILPVRPGGDFPWVEMFMVSATTGGYLAIALLAFFQPGRDVRKTLLSLFGVAIAYELVLPLNEGGFAVLVAGNLVFYLLSGLQYGVELHLAGSVPVRHPWLARQPWLIRLFYIVGFACGLWGAWNVLARAFDWGWSPAAILSTANLMDYFFFPTWIIGLMVLLGTQASRHPEPLVRHQAGLILLGILPWIGMVMWITLQVLQGHSSPDWVDLAWAAVLLPFPVTVFIAMYRYQLFDIQFIVRKGLVYSALTGTLLVAFYTLLGAGSFVLSGFMAGGVPSVWLFAGTALILGLLFQKLSQAVQHVIDRRFFPERRAFRQRLITLAGELPMQGKVPLMGKHLVERLRDIFRLKSVALLLADIPAGLLYSLDSAPPGALGEATLLSLEDELVRLARRARKPVSIDRKALRDWPLADDFDARELELAVPLLVQEQLGGLLLVGRKESGQEFTAEETEMLDFLARHVSIVFENAKLFESATFDNLTGALRREAILERLLLEMKRAARYGRPITVGMVDLDHFKSVNDRYGHLAGDMVLKQVAGGIARTLRSSDLLGRYGGEEFLLVFPEPSLEAAMEMAERRRGVVERSACRIGGSSRIRVTLSVGLATPESDAGDPAAVAALIDRADQALLTAKREGRNRVQVTLPRLKE